MTEIQFLADLLLKETMSEQLRVKMLTRIADVELSRIPNLNLPTTVSYHSLQSNVIYGCQHEYPNPWMSTLPPACKKCGLAASNWFAITSSAGNGSDLTLPGNTATSVKLIK